MFHEHAFMSITNFSSQTFTMWTITNSYGMNHHKLIWCHYHPKLIWYEPSQTHMLSLPSKLKCTILFTTLYIYVINFTCYTYHNNITVNFNVCSSVTYPVTYQCAYQTWGSFLVINPDKSYHKPIPQIPDNSFQWNSDISSDIMITCNGVHKRKFQNPRQNPCKSYENMLIFGIFFSKIYSLISFIFT